MRPVPPLLMRFKDRLRRIGPDQRGIAAVEFALILPIMLALFLGMSAVQPGYGIQRKIGVVARTVADLSSRADKITTVELKTIFGAAIAIMRPYDDTSTKQYGLTQLVVSSVTVEKKGKDYIGKVKWSCPWNLVPASPGPGPAADDLKQRAKNSLVEVPEVFRNDATTSFIYVDALFPYTPNVGQVITGTLKLRKSYGWDVRDAKEVAEPGCPT